MVSEAWHRYQNATGFLVLILVLVEDGLGGTKRILLYAIMHTVLILVLVEDGLGGKAASLCEAYLNGLNPCFSGGWSRRSTTCKAGQ